MTGQNLAIVSEIKGTTTDPVQKAMELLPLGPVVMIDTPAWMMRRVGTKARRKKLSGAAQDRHRAVGGGRCRGMQAQDRALLARVKEMNLPYLVVYNKCDEQDRPMEDEAHAICVSAVRPRRDRTQGRIAHLTPDDAHKVPLIADLIDPMDYIVLVVPDRQGRTQGAAHSAPAADHPRDILEAGAVAVVVQETELKATLASLGKRPRMVVTDSQAL